MTHGVYFTSECFFQKGKEGKAFGEHQWNIRIIERLINSGVII